MRSDIKNRLGERRMMNCGEETEIIEYVNNSNITIKFLKTDELIRCQYDSFKKGLIKSHFTPTVYGVGIVGLKKARYSSGEHIRAYDIWKNMLRRCYDKKYQEKFPTYIGCIVCEEWLHYKNFKKWYDDNYYEIEGQKMCLDKDILIKGNKVYSPETCIFVPQNINSLFLKNNNSRGDLPIGVCYKKQNKKYQAYCNIFNIESNKYTYTYLGLYNTPEEAFEVYKKTKEENIKLVANYYKDRIPSKLYDAMYEYEVEIDD